MAEKDKEDKKYNRLKEFEGSKYSGMKVGASHKWYYDQGQWRERKVTPNEWDLYYQTTKRRAGKAPEGSGAPVGTEYNWLVVAHQGVDKLDANSYITRLEGKKFKVAHKRASKGEWSISEKAQRKKVIQYLEQVIEDLKAADENENIPYTIGKGERIYGIDHMTVAELSRLASEHQIPNRSKMKREELLQAIKNKINGRQKEIQETVKEEAIEKEQESGISPQEEQDLQKEVVAPRLSRKSKVELYEMAQKRGIKDRSKMKKGDLVKALRKRLANEEF